MSEKNLNKKNNLSSAKVGKTIRNSLVHIFLAVLSVIWLFPIFWVIMTSFRVENEGKGSYTKKRAFRRIGKITEVVI